MEFRPKKAASLLAVWLAIASLSLAFAATTPSTPAHPAAFVSHDFAGQVTSAKLDRASRVLGNLQLHALLVSNPALTSTVLVGIVTPERAQYAVSQSPHANTSRAPPQFTSNSD